MDEKQELAGIAELAKLFGVSRQVVANWRSRYHDFPKPVAELKSGPVYKIPDIVNWATENNIAIQDHGVIEGVGQEAEAKARAAIVVAMVNMKGGVGKSTLCVNLGWYCAQRLNKRVLLIDLDPQFNLSQYTLGPTKYEKLMEDKKGTIFEVFEQFTPVAAATASKGELIPQDVITNVRKLYSGGVLDLVPSRLDLAWTLKNPHAKEHLLNQFIDEVRGDYNLVLIDCPPTESMLTTSAYLASDWVLVPVRPEFLSTIGLPLLVRSLDEFRGRFKGKEIDILGIVFNAASEKREHDRSREYVRRIAKDRDWYVFKHEVTFSDSYPRGSREGRPIFLTDYARSSKIAEFGTVAREFTERIGLDERSQ